MFIVDLNNPNGKGTMSTHFGCELYLSISFSFLDELDPVHLSFSLRSAVIFR